MITNRIRMPNLCTLLRAVINVMIMSPEFQGTWLTSHQSLPPGGSQPACSALQWSELGCLPRRRAPHDGPGELCRGDGGYLSILTGDVNVETAPQVAWPTPSPPLRRSPTRPSPTSPLPRSPATWAGSSSATSATSRSCACRAGSTTTRDIPYGR